MEPKGEFPPGSSTAIRAQDRTVRVLVSLADDLIVGHDEGGLVRTTLDHVVTTLGLSGGVTYLLDEDQVLRVAAERTGDGDDDVGAQDLAQLALERKRPQFRELPEGGWIAAALLSTRTQSLGVLTLYDRKDTGVAPDHELLEALGKQIGTGLENARLYAELRASSTRQGIMNRITAALAGGMDLKTVIPNFARELAGLQTFDRLVCGFVNDSGDYIEVVGYPEGTTWGLGSVIPVVGSGPGSVVLNSRAVLERNLFHSHRFIEDLRLLDEGVQSYVLLPLNSRGRSIGVLGLGSSQQATFDDGTLARLQPLADSVALAFENVRLFQKTRELSITDEVTPLYNVRFFHQILERELKLVDRYRSVLALIFVDLDRFKPINDQFGHLRGSRVLREVGFLLRSAVRETDYPARYGGDEFVVILPQTDLPSAQALGEKLRSLIEAHAFLQEEGINARVGVSLGVACYPQEATSKEALIRLADERMYQDKDRRR
jgi:diguanylate cyclase (GGDEF)-like protein